MILYLSISSLVLLLYLLYPLYLLLQRKQGSHICNLGSLQKVSLIFLSRNGGPDVINKIKFLYNEISNVEGSELIVIDDHSMDVSGERFRELNLPGLRIHLKEKSMGIPHSMNLGVSMAVNDLLVFCDQRQTLPREIIKKLTEPLRDPLTGAVSACISCYDKQHGFSLLRHHENFIKRLEGDCGNLIGVYGPLYAIKRECYRNIPDHIILDDLFLSLAILPKYNIRFMPEVTVTDDSPDRLYNYSRAKRYLKGLIQLLFERELWHALKFKQKVMLLWHKYLRLIIPMLALIGFMLLYISRDNNTLYYYTFISVSVMFVFSFILSFLFNKMRLRNMITIQLYYPIAFIELILTGAAFRRDLKTS